MLASTGAAGKALEASGKQLLVAGIAVAEANMAAGEGSSKPPAGLSSEERKVSRRFPEAKSNIYTRTQWP
jgi:hypothetical protein